MADPAITRLFEAPRVVLVVVLHRRAETFRWMGLVEVTVITVLLLLFLPLLAAGLLVAPLAAAVYIGLGAAKVVAVIAGIAGVFGSLEIPHRALQRDAFRKFHRELEVRVYDSARDVVGTWRTRVTHEEVGRRVLAQVLREARDRRLVLVELVDAPLSCAEVWYGGRPLLCEPGLPATSTTRPSVEADGTVVTLSASGVEVARPLRSTGRVLAALLLLLMPVIAPALWVLRRPVRPALRRLWCDLRGVRRTLVFRASEGAVEVAEEANTPIETRRVEADELLGITWSEALTWGRGCRRVPASLRIIGQEHTIELPADRVGPRGRSVRNLLLAGAIHGDAAASGETHCPYCGTRHVMVAGQGCPSCGGWPEVLAS